MATAYPTIEEEEYLLKGNEIERKMQITFTSEKL